MAIHAFLKLLQEVHNPEEISKHVTDNIIKAWWKNWDCNWEINKETSRKKWVWWGDVVILTNWISKINIKKPHFKREKPKKGTKHLRTERLDKRSSYQSKAPSLLCKNYWDCQWKRRHWSRTRNKINQWLLYKVKLIFIISIYFIIYIGIIFNWRK